MLALFQRRLKTNYVLRWLRMWKKRWMSGMVCSGKPAKKNQENDRSSYNRQRNSVSGLVKKCKSRYNRDLLKDSANSPVKFWSAIKKLYPTKLPCEQGSAFMINGSKSADKSFIAMSFCEYFSTTARNLKSKSIALRHFVWSKPAEENLPNQVTESQFTFKVAKESEILIKSWKVLSGKRRLAWIIFPGIAQTRCSCFDWAFDIYYQFISWNWSCAQWVESGKGDSPLQIWLSGWDRQLQTYLNFPHFVKNPGENSLQAANGSSGAS